MLAKCYRCALHRRRENAEFYIIDAKGILVWHKDKFEVDMESSGEKKPCQNPCSTIFVKVLL